MSEKTTALVTGANKGIGYEIAAGLGALGWRVGVGARDEARREAAVEKLRAAGVDAFGVALDVTDDASVDAAARQLEETEGRLDVLVNNAAVYVWQPVDKVSYRDWQQAWQETLAVNLTGTANAIWCAVRYMKDTGGRIINISSRGAVRGEPEHPAYAASKGGLNSLSGSLARRLAPYGIAVATVAPGFVETDMAAEIMATEAGAAVRAQSPFNRIATTEEIAAAVIYLASPQAQWASGAILDLNGASYLRP